MELQKSQIVKVILSKKNQGGSIILPDFKLYYKAIINKQYSLDTKTDIQTNVTIKIPEINLHLYGQLIFDKDTKNTQWRKDSFFGKWC